MRDPDEPQPLPDDPIELQVVTGALRAACEEMGVVLIRSAHSSNIKERRDASTALFDADGQMVMQAEHIPVHLGAMPAAVAAVLDERARARRLVDPQRPVRRRHPPARHHRHHARLRAARALLLGFAASRAHHADVGGAPARLDARRQPLARRGGRRDLAAAARRARRSRSSSRGCASRPSAAPTCAPSSPPTASARSGCASWRERLGAERLREATDAVLDYSERRTRACLAALPDGSSAGRGRARGARGRPRCCACARSSTASGCCSTSPAARAQHEGNLNCPLAVTRSACLFAVRVLTDPDIPPSAGAYRPIEVRAPAGSVLNARPGAAVAAGNVETSSRVADLVLSAFGRAQGQGTMNNLTLGDDALLLLRDARRRPGRLPGRRRAERRARRDEQHAQHPDRGARARIPAARGRVRAAPRLGRRGRQRGGDGVVRELQALAEMSFSLIAERRRHARAAPTAAARRAAGATCSTAAPCRARPPARCAPASGCASKRPVGEDSGRRVTAYRRNYGDARAERPRVGFLGLGIMGSRMAANVARAGFR